MKLADVKRVKLANLPTPLEAMPNLSKRLGGALHYIKRDDETGLGLSGNKVRKLEYLVADALAQGATTLLTFGGPQTNHGRLTAAAAVRCGLKCVLVLNGEKPAYYSGNLVLDALMGADLRFGWDGTDAFAKAIVKEYEAKGERVYTIPMGGSNVLGALGYVEMVREVVEQCRQMAIAPRYLVAAAGSQGTLAGLVAGAKYYGAPFEVVPVAVSPESPRTAATAADFVNRLSAAYGLGVSAAAEEIRLVAGRGSVSYAGAGYNQPDADTRAMIRLLAETEAIFLDPCYTAKAFHGFVDLAQHEWQGESAIFLHTGGVPALWTKEHLDAFQPDLQAARG